MDNPCNNCPNGATTPCIRPNRCLLGDRYACWQDIENSQKEFDKLTRELLEKELPIPLGKIEPLKNPSLEDPCPTCRAYPNCEVGCHHLREFTAEMRKKGFWGVIEDRVPGRIKQMDCIQHNPPNTVTILGEKFTLTVQEEDPPAQPEPHFAGSCLCRIKTGELFITVRKSALSDPLQTFFHEYIHAFNDIATGRGANEADCDLFAAQVSTFIRQNPDTWQALIKTFLPKGEK